MNLIPSSRLRSLSLLAGLAFLASSLEAHPRADYVRAYEKADLAFQTMVDAAESGDGDGVLSGYGEFLDGLLLREAGERYEPGSFDTTSMMGIQRTWAVEAGEAVSIPLPLPVSAMTYEQKGRFWNAPVTITFDLPASQGLEDGQDHPAETTHDSSREMGSVRGQPIQGRSGPQVFAGEGRLEVSRTGHGMGKRSVELTVRFVGLEPGYATPTDFRFAAPDLSAGPMLVQNSPFSALALAVSAMARDADGTDSGRIVDWFRQAREGFRAASETRRSFLEGLDAAQVKSFLHERNTMSSHEVDGISYHNPRIFDDHQTHRFLKMIGNIDELAAIAQSATDLIAEFKERGIQIQVESFDLDGSARSDATRQNEALDALVAELERAIDAL